MTVLTDFCTEIRGWLGRDEADFNDAIVTTWIRMAEQRLSDDLRVKDMVKISKATLVDSRVELPDDWLELDFVRAVGKYPLKYITRDVMYSDSPGISLKDKYTLTGNYLVVGNVDFTAGTEIETSYYGAVPALNDEETWLMVKHRSLYVAATLVWACAYGVEDSRAQTWEAYVTSQADKLNLSSKVSSTSGSSLAIRPRRM